VKRLFLVLAVAALAGCGGAEHGEVTLWVTRDRGAQVILERTVPAGLTAMQALDRVADIRTRYAGRYVQEINGIRGSLSTRHDWFYFINGYEADRSAAEYRLHNGDVEWWDFRSWQSLMRAPIVVGAFPEPFLHGFDGKTLPARVVYSEPRQRAAAERLARFLRARATDNPRTFSDSHVNVLALVPIAPGDRPFLLANAGSNTSPGKPILFRFGGDPALLLKNPPFGRLRYQVRG
jgi:Domain of unknown function (DUF4430)